MGTLIWPSRRHQSDDAKNALFSLSASQNHPQTKQIKELKKDRAKKRKKERESRSIGHLTRLSLKYGANRASLYNIKTTKLAPR
jgi:hypothetical protein